MLTFPVTMLGAQNPGGGFTPADLGSLYAWWDLSDSATVTASGSPLRIDSIADKSGHGYTLSKVVSGPQIGVNTLNALDVCTWTGSTGEKLVTAGSHSFGDFTLLVVYRFTANNPARRLADHNYSTGWWLGRDNSTATGDGGGVEEASSPYGHFITQPTSVWRITAMRRTGTAKLIYGNDGAAVSATVSSAATAGAPIALGNDVNSTNGVTPMTGDEAEVVLCNASLSPADLNNLGNYLAGKWGLSWANL